MKTGSLDRDVPPCTSLHPDFNITEASGSHPSINNQVIKKKHVKTSIKMDQQWSAEMDFGTSKAHLNFMCIQQSHVQTCHLFKDGNKTWCTDSGQSGKQPAIKMPFGDVTSTFWWFQCDFRVFLMGFPMLFYGWFDATWWNNTSRMGMSASRTTGPAQPSSSIDPPSPSLAQTRRELPLSWRGPTDCSSVATAV